MSWRFLPSRRRRRGTTCSKRSDARRCRDAGRRVEPAFARIGGMARGRSAAGQLCGVLLHRRPGYRPAARAGGMVEDLRGALKRDADIGAPGGAKPQQSGPNSDADSLSRHHPAQWGYALSAAGRPGADPVFVHRRRSPCTRWSTCNVGLWKRRIHTICRRPARRRCCIRRRTAGIAPLRWCSRERMSHPRCKRRPRSRFLPPLQFDTVSQVPSPRQRAGVQSSGGSQASSTSQQLGLGAEVQTPFRQP